MTRPGRVNDGAFDPLILVTLTAALLDAAGLPSTLDDANARAAREAAQALLTAFGVRPWRPLDRRRRQ